MTRLSRPQAGSVHINFPGNFGPQGYPPAGYGPSLYSYPPPRRRRTGLLVGIVIAALVLVGGGATLLIVLLNKGGGGSAQGVADDYLAAVQSSDKSAVYDISCQTMTMAPVTESGNSATAQITFAANGQTGNTAISLYKNDNGTWLVCDSPLATADQDR